MMSTSSCSLNQGLFGEQQQQQQDQMMGFLPLLPLTNMMIYPPPLGITSCNININQQQQQQQQQQQPLKPSFNSILSPNSLASEADSTSNLTAETLIATATAQNNKSRLDLTSSFAASQFLSLNRSTLNPCVYRALGEVNDCFSSKRSNDQQQHVHVGVSSMKMKKIKGRRKVREPRFSFKTMSDVDVLDDGYKWRKYGQKVVKNTQHPRSYYRCTQDNCRVKKRVERLAEDPRMVITTYEGRHAHSPSNDLEDSQSPSQLSNFFW